MNNDQKQQEMRFNPKSLNIPTKGTVSFLAGYNNCKIKLKKMTSAKARPFVLVLNLLIATWLVPEGESAACHFHTNYSTGRKYNETWSNSRDDIYATRPGSRIRHRVPDVIPTEKHEDNRKCAKAAIQGLRQNFVPQDLIYKFGEYSKFNDWTRFSEIFEQTNRTKSFLEWAAKYMGSMIAEKGEYTFSDKSVSWTAVVDENANIVSLRLGSRGAPQNRKLTDSDFKDLSKLPPKLELFNLDSNALTDINMTQLPGGMQLLDLTSNSIRQIDWKSLPRGLRRLMLGRNLLTSAYFWGVLPPNLQWLILSHNRLLHVATDGLPNSLKKLWLNHNRLVMLDLTALPLGLCELLLHANPLTARDPLIALRLPVCGFPTSLYVNINLPCLPDVEEQDRRVLRSEELSGWKRIMHQQKKQRAKAKKEARNMVKGHAHRKASGAL